MSLGGIRFFGKKTSSPVDALNIGHEVQLIQLTKIMQRLQMIFEKRKYAFSTSLLKMICNDRYLSGRLQSSLSCRLLLLLIL